ncbi:MAG: RNA-binding S4 domain-containing protein, partial [Epsilonproteobacteria bacterium]|nr:RNA-binding S4 domain-containing protein [Campylobacterota bacterium]
FYLSLFLYLFTLTFGSKMTYTLNGEFIELHKLIKLLDLVDTGGQAKMLIEDQLVRRNGAIETRKRAKILKGDIIQIGDVTITVI